MALHDFCHCTLLLQLWLMLLLLMVVNVVVAIIHTFAYPDVLMHMQLMYLVAVTGIVMAPL